jgi:putative tryptophan/tyrosine transport system substrate-binding protein
VKRRAFIAGLGTAAAWPVVARAQQPNRLRRIGVLMPFAVGDPQYQARIGAFLQGLAALGWIESRNVRIEQRGSTGDTDELRKYATELVSFEPDVILATGVSTVGPLQHATHNVPIVFVVVPDPVGAGIVDSLARPGGNTTGFALYEYSIGGKWLELLKQIAPRVTRVAIIRNAAISAGIGQFAAIQSMAPLAGVELTPMNVRDASEIERAIAAFAGTANSGLIVTGSALVAAQRDLLVALTARYKLPAVYYERTFVAAGGLLSYGPNNVDQYRLAAGYVDRVLKGEKPADLPVQSATKYELVINLKTAKSLGLTIPETLLATADEVIQ